VDGSAAVGAERRRRGEGRRDELVDELLAVLASGPLHADDQWSTASCCWAALLSINMTGRARPGQLDAERGRSDSSMPSGEVWLGRMAFSVIRGDQLEFGHPSWRPEDTTRQIVEVTRLAPLRHSRANLWRYPPGAESYRHVQLAQEETFVVLEGTLSMLLGEPPQVYHLPAHSIVVVEPLTPLKVMNDSDADVLFFVYGAPSDPSAEVVEDVPEYVKKRIGPADIPS
jgi:hypothetical protein